MVSAAHADEMIELSAFGTGDVSRKVFAFPVDRRTAYRTEMEGQGVAAFGGPFPRRSPAIHGDLLAAETRLVANRCSGTALANL